MHFGVRHTDRGQDEAVNQFCCSSSGLRSSNHHRIVGDMTLLSKRQLPFLEEVVKQEHRDQSVHSCSTDPARSD